MAENCWVTGVITTLLIGAITPLITGKGDSFEEK